MLGALLFGINDLLGDPIGAVAEAASDAAESERRRTAALPANRLASTRLHLWEMLQIYEKSLIWHKEAQVRYPTDENQKIIDDYQAKVNDYKEKLKLLS